MKACAFCAESIQDAATLCRFCQKEQPASAVAAATAPLFSGHVQHRLFWPEYLLAACLVPLYGVGLVFLGIVYLRAVTTKWLITPSLIQGDRGVLAKKVDNLELYRVRDLQYEQTILDRLTGLGRIHVFSTDATAPTVTLLGLPKHRELFEKLRAAIETSRQTTGVRTVEA